MTDQPIALVTGATSGIGLAVAKGLKEAGFRLVLCGRRAELLAEAAAETEGDAQVCDVGDPHAVTAMFVHIKQRHGRLDVVFNNAGRGAPSAPIGDVSIEEWRQTVAVNLDGAFFVAREAFRLMREQAPQGGRIINNGSISAHAPRPGSAPYTATKHAITGLTKSIALDGRAFNITASQIDIGNAATAMTGRMSGGVPQADGQIRPEPTMELRHVVDAVVYMARLPLEANVPFMTVMATTMPYIGRG